jgi:hypothetical protein
VDIIDINEEKLEKRDPKLLEILLKDNTTKQNIKWATNNYLRYGFGYAPECEIKTKLITGHNKNIIQPRVCKPLHEQYTRTKEKAEVFTPSWVCNEQNNLIDDSWFNKKNVFNYTNKNGWVTNSDKVIFLNESDLEKYIDSKRIEVSCGEAPYLVSRYDTVTGAFIPVSDRIGLLDRKLRVINENINDKEEWFRWVTRAFQSVYGYEYQGDNVLLARENLLYTFVDNMTFKFNCEPSTDQLKSIANIISWNIWQMDGVTLTAPFSESKTSNEQLSFFELDAKNEKSIPVYCLVYDWDLNQIVEFQKILKES